MTFELSDRKPRHIVRNRDTGLPEGFLDQYHPALPDELERFRGAVGPVAAIILEKYNAPIYVMNGRSNIRVSTTDEHMKPEPEPGAKHYFRTDYLTIFNDHCVDLTTWRSIRAGQNPQTVCRVDFDWMTDELEESQDKRIRGLHTDAVKFLRKLKFLVEHIRSDRIDIHPDDAQRERIYRKKLGWLRNVRFLENNQSVAGKITQLVGKFDARPHVSSGTARDALQSMRLKSA